VAVVLGVALAAEGTAGAEEDGGDGPGSEGGPGEGNGLDTVGGREAGVGEGAVGADNPGAVERRIVSFQFEQGMVRSSTHVMSEAATACMPTARKVKLLLR
jgi:hypothetical protein